LLKATAGTRAASFLFGGRDERTIFRLRQGVAQFVRWLRPYAHFRHRRIRKKIQLKLNRARKEKESQ
jgi:hypothetical protein